MSSLTFKQLKEKSTKRARRWHKGSLNTWSVNDWLCALGGEAGEALNAGKKLRRMMTKMQQHGDVPTNLKEAKEKILEELADVVIYADLVATRLGANLEDSIILKFNSVSRRENFPERLSCK